MIIERLSPEPFREQRDERLSHRCSRVYSPLCDGWPARFINQGCCDVGLNWVEQLTGLKFFEDWGVKYQCVMTWTKNVGFTPFSWMYSTEHVLFGRIGSLPLLKNGMRLDFKAKVREHSRKPEEFYDLVRKASPEKRIDIFAREKHEGFDAWGLESEKFEEAV